MKIRKLFKTENIEEYIKKSSDPSGNRKYKRLPTTVPVLYSFSKKEKKENFKQANTIDVSNGGIAIEVLNLPDEDARKRVIINYPIAIKIDIPSQEELIEFIGKIKWKRLIESKNNVKTLIGVEYVKIDPDDKVNILSHGLRINRRKKLVKLSIITLSIIIIATTAWGIHTYISKQKVQEKLVISETARSKLEKDIRAMIKLKEELSRDLEENARRLRTSEAMLNIKEKQIKETENILKEKEKALNSLQDKVNDQEKDIAKTNERLNSIKKFIAQLEERIYFYVVTSDPELVFLSSRSDTSVFDNENYKKAVAAMRNNRCNDAINLFQLVIDEKPRSPFGFSGLARAYHCLGNHQKSKEVFQNYLKWQQKDMESE